MASELRQIRETLAKMQAEKVRQVDKVIASANVRKAVVHNVHFNAPPEIVKAHFSGCDPRSIVFPAARSTGCIGYVSQ